MIHQSVIANSSLSTTDTDCIIHTALVRLLTIMTLHMQFIAVPVIKLLVTFAALKRYLLQAVQLLHVNTEISATPAGSRAEFTLVHGFISCMYKLMSLQSRTKI